MEYNVNLNANNRNIDVSVSLKKEDGEADFLEDLGNIFNSNAKLGELPDGATDVTDVD